MVKISTLMTISIPIAISIVFVGKLAGAVGSLIVKAGFVNGARFEFACVAGSPPLPKVCSDWEPGELAVVLVLSGGDTEPRTTSELIPTLVGPATPGWDEDKQSTGKLIHFLVQ